jgi:hypothetical protein
MIHIVLYAGLAWLVTGAIVYAWGSHMRERAGASARLAPAESKSTVVYRHLAHSAQAVNFLVHTVATTALTAADPAPIGALYNASVRRAFSGKNLFITTGAPHSRALYLRNFAWFYPDLFDLATIIDAMDEERRIVILYRSLRTALETAGARPYTTTIVPITARRFAAVNYVTPPSDSALGILSGIEQLVDAPSSATQECGNALLAKHSDDIALQLAHLAAELETVIINKKKYRLLDARKNRSSATDTRRERMRFVVSANVWATFAKAEKLGLMDGKVFAAFGLEKTQYKRDILELFGSEGYIKNSIDPAFRGAKETDNITLDFAHVRNGFWDLSQPDEQALFANTADLIFSDPTFRDISTNCHFVANRNPEYGALHRYTTPSYHGRTVWPSFNTEFAARLLDLAAATGDDRYRYRAERILLQLKEYIERNGGYPELLHPDGTPYRTWIYKSAVADSWFPRFMGVWSRAFVPRRGRAAAADRTALRIPAFAVES